jgi:plastocyanin
MLPIRTLVAIIVAIAMVQTPTAVTIQGFAFRPAELSIGVGTTVQWTNQDGAPHQVESDDGTLAGPVMGTGATFSFTFGTPGRITYHCAIHPSMNGVVVVQ